MALLAFTTTWHACLLRLHWGKLWECCIFDYDKRTLRC